MSSFIDMNVTPKQLALLKSMFEKLAPAIEEFNKEYGIVMPLYYGNAEVYSGYTSEQFEELSLADVSYAILKNVQAISEHLNIPLDEVVQKALQSVEWYQEALKESFRPPAILIPKTNQPKQFIMAKDKITNTLFDGKLTVGSKDILVGMENRKSKKELTAVVSIDFEELPNVTISKTITAFDREVHDAIVSLYVDGNNELVTPLMIYRTMTGDAKANITSKKAEAISNSVTKCSMTRIIIDSSEEADAFGMDKMFYEGNLLYTKKVKGEHNGKIGEWIYILEQPILYNYADNKGQIARSDIQLLNTPINKNDEAIVLQGYLLRRILTMQGSRINRNIVYETVYRHLKIEATSAGALRKKQSKIRDTSKEILQDWVSKGFIRGYKENQKGKSIVSLTIDI